MLRGLLGKRESAPELPPPPPPPPPPGWAAIDTALALVYGHQPPRHVSYQLPGTSSKDLQGCSAYAALDHWHYVSYGLSELYSKTPGSDPAHSGWGFELTFRVPRTPQESAAPDWPFAIMNEVANFVNENKVLLGPGSRVDLQQNITGYPNIAGAPPTQLSVFALCEDSQLRRIHTPHGALSFLQLVGVSFAEKNRMIETSTAEVLALLARGNPLLVTDPARA